MKKRNLFIAGLPLLAMAGSIASCSGNNVDIAMISDIGRIDDGSFNQFTYEGVKQYGDEAKLKYGYYVPNEDTEQSRLDGINTYIRRGAKVVVLTGYKFEDLVPDLMKKHPNVGFLLIDGSVANSDKNVYSMAYKEQEAGYLAGYAVGLDQKYTKFGFLGGMAVPAVERFGFGFVSGLSDALKELNDAGTETKFELQYNYTNSFASGDTEKSLASAMYTAGAEVIFSCGGAICESVYAAASAAGVSNHKIIGVDVDQYNQHTDAYITSAEKKLQSSTHDALKSFFDNNKAWPSDKAGKNATLDSKGNYVGLPTEGNSWTFTKFTKDKYNEIYKKLQNDADYTKITTTSDGVRVVSGKTIDTQYFNKIIYGTNATGEKANVPVAAK